MSLCFTVEISRAPPPPFPIFRRVRSSYVVGWRKAKLEGKGESRHV